MMFIAWHLRSLFAMLHDLWSPLKMINEPPRQETSLPHFHKDIIGKGKGRGKVVHVDALKAHRRSRGIAPLILNLAITRR